MKPWVIERIGGLLLRVDQEIARTLAGPSEESVHDLRTSIRRARESLRVFSGFFPDKNVRKVRKHLQGLMHLAAEIRNRDVVLDLLVKSETRGAALRRSLEAQAASFRRRLLAELKQLQEGNGAGEWREKTVDAAVASPTRAKTGWRPKHTPEENAATVLPELGRKYWKAGRKLLGRHLDFETLHRFRLKTKRYRYTLELFRGVSPAVEQELERLKPVQDLFGEINDCATALDLIGGSKGKHPRFAQFLHERAAKRIAKLAGVL